MDELRKPNYPQTNDFYADIPAGKRREAVLWYVPANVAERPFIVDVDGEVLARIMHEEGWTFAGDDHCFDRIPGLRDLPERKPGIYRMEVSFHFNPQEIEQHYPKWFDATFKRLLEGPAKVAIPSGCDVEQDCRSYPN